ncbi:MAG: hypothetical protein ABJK11_14810 [Balneola sp.]
MSSSSTNSKDDTAWNQIKNLITKEKEKGNTPIKILIPRNIENSLMLVSSDAVGNELVEKISTVGVRDAFPQMLGLEVVWDSDELKILNKS